MSAVTGEIQLPPYLDYQQLHILSSSLDSVHPLTAIRRGAEALLVLLGQTIATKGLRRGSHQRHHSMARYLEGDFLVAYQSLGTLGCVLLQASRESSARPQSSE